MSFLFTRPRPGTFGTAGTLRLRKLDVSFSMSGQVHNSLTHLLHSQGELTYVLT